MFSQEMENLVQQISRIQKVLWLALTSAIVVYAVVAHMIASSAESIVGASVRNVFYLVGAGIAVASLFMRRRVFSEEGLRNLAKATPDLNEWIESRGMRLDIEISKKIQSLSRSEQKTLAVTANAAKEAVGALMISEGVAVAGLVLALVDQDPFHTITFGSGALLLHLSAFPKTEEIARRAYEIVLRQG